MPLLQVLESPRIKEGQIRFNGKLFKGVRKRTGNREEMLLTDLQDLVRNQIIVGKPIHLEHKGSPVGRIERAWLDMDDWLCIEGKIFGRKKLGNQHDEIRSGLRHKHYKDLSISFVRNVLPDGSHSNHQFVEASLTEKGRIEGSVLYSVMASAESSQSEAHAFTADAQFTFTMSGSDIEKTVERLNTEYNAGLSMADLPAEGAHEYLRRTEKMLENLKKSAEERIAQLQQEQDAKDKTLQRLLAKEEEQMRREDEINLKTAEEVKKIVASRLPKDQRESYSQHLTELATDRENRMAWNSLQAMAVVVKDANDSKAALNAELTRALNSIKELEKNNEAVAAERDTFRTQIEQGVPQMVQNSMKRKDVGVDEKEVGGEKRQKTEVVKLSEKEAQLNAIHPLRSTGGKDPIFDEWEQKLRSELLGTQTGEIIPWTRDSITFTSERSNVPS